VNHYQPVERLLSPAQFAGQTPLSEESVRRRCRDGSIPGARRLGKLWLIPESSLCRLGNAAPMPTPDSRRLPDDPIEREAFWCECDREIRQASNRNHHNREVR